MQYLHHNKFMHRDLKSLNVLIDGDFVAKGECMPTCESDIASSAKSAKGMQSLPR